VTDLLHEIIGTLRRTRIVLYRMVLFPVTLIDPNYTPNYPSFVTSRHCTKTAVEQVELVFVTEASLS